MNRPSDFARRAQFARRATKQPSAQSFEELFGGRVDQLEARFDTSLFEAELFGTAAPLPARNRDRSVRRAPAAAPWSAETQASSLAENAMPDPPWTGRIPPRTKTTGGRAFMATIDRLRGDARENKIEAELRAGNIPDFLRTPRINLVFVPTPDGVVHSVSYRVMPDYLCIGTDDDYVRIPVNAITAQRIADAWGLFLPTAKMVDQIYENAEVPLAAAIPPYSGTPQQADTAKLLDHHDRIMRQIDRLDALPAADRRPPWRIARWRLGALVAGHKKEIVTSLLAYGYPKKLMFYGWFKADGVPIEPASGRKGIADIGHEPAYSDYSHGARLVSRMALVDGAPRAIVDVLHDKKLHVLLSGEGAPYPASQEPRATVQVQLPAPAPVTRESSEDALDLIPALDASIKKVTLYPRITLGGEGPAAAVTGIFVPKAFVARPKIDAILWLQGHHSLPPSYPADLNIYDYWDRTRHPLFRFREDLNVTGRSLILVAPTLGPTSGAGWLVDAGGLDRYLELVRKALVASSAGVSDSATWGNLVIACHSGGGARMLKIATETNVLGANITQCWGFDCLYHEGDVPAWISWANQGGKRLYVYYGNGGTAERSRKLEAEARKQWLLNVSVYVDGSTSTGHNEVPIKYWRQRIEALPAPAGARRVGAASAFDEVVRRSAESVVRFGEDAEAWQVVARPGMPVARARLRDGDKVLQRPAGESRLTVVRTLGDDTAAPALFGADGSLRADTLVLRRADARADSAAGDTGAGAELPGQPAVDLIETVPRSGRGSFRHAALGGDARDNVEARWNVDATTTAGSTIAVVVHLHGYGRATPDFLARKTDTAGVDMVDAAGTVRSRRQLPTLALVPRGEHRGGSSWFFDRVLPDEPTFRALVDAGLAYLATTVLGLAPGSTLSRGRLTVMAHSGGGAGLSTLLGHRTNPLNPDEVVCFDSMYGGEDAIVRWAVAKIASPQATTAGVRAFYTACEAPSAAYPSGRWVANPRRTGWVYQPPGSWSYRDDNRWHLISTEVSARRLQFAIDRALERRPAADRPALAGRFRVERASVPHDEIPARYAPLLLDDIAATVPRAAAPPAATVRPGCVRNDDWLTRPPLKLHGDDPKPSPPTEPPTAGEEEPPALAAEFVSTTVVRRGPARSPIIEDPGSAEDMYRASKPRLYTPSADPALFRTAPTPVAVSPATEWPAPTGDAAGATSRALRAAGATAAAVAAYAGAGLTALGPIASVFGEAAMTELVGRLRYTPAQLESPPHSYDNDTQLGGAFHIGRSRANVPRKTVLAMRLLLTIPGHFRQLARRTDDDQEAFALENLGWLIMGSLRDEVATATGTDFWVPPPPAFVAPFPNPIPPLSDQVRRLVLRSGLIDDTQGLPAFLARLGAWRAGAAGRMWRLETGRDPAAGRPLGAPFYPEPFTIPASINTATQREQVRHAWTRRVAAFDAGTSTRPLTECDNSSLAPLGLMAPVSLGALHLRGHFPVARTSAPLSTLQGLAVVRPAFEAAFQAVANLGWNDLLFETQGMGCFRGMKVPGRPAAARTISEHSLGIAIDLNAFENTQNTTGSMDPRVVALFESFRFRWGKGFPTPDPMHFEYAG